MNPTTPKKPKKKPTPIERAARAGIDPKAEPGPPPMPPGVAGDPAVASAWRQFVTEAPAGVVAAADAKALETLARTWVNWTADAKELAATGSVVVVNGQPQRTPYFESYHKNLNVCLKLLQEFGMTPASRAKFAKPPEPEAKPDDNFDDLDG